MKYSFTISLALFALVTSGHPLDSVPIASIPPRRREEIDLRVRAQPVRDLTTKKKDPPEKYFHEAIFHSHYDGRFAEKALSYEDKKTHLVPLMQTYLSTMNDIGAETWIMHGSLLGWFWNRKIMPWDSDVDVQMSMKSMDHLAKYYNMTMHHFKLPGISDGRDYMLEINPHYTNDSTTDDMNVIDGRWVDTETGLFIDITTLRHNLTAQAEGHEGYMMCKDRHHYNFSDIFPLRESLFEGVPVRIPFAYGDLLVEEYGPEAVTKLDFESHHFDQQTMEWQRKSPSYFRDREKGPFGEAPKSGGEKHRLPSYMDHTPHYDAPPPTEPEVGSTT